MPKENEPPKSLIAPNDAFTVLMAACNVMGACFWPFLRKKCGCRIPGGFGVGALLFMVGYTQAYRSNSMAKFTIVWLFLLVILRITHDRRTHSRYTGIPHLEKLPPVRWLAPYKREASARAVEPILLFTISALLHEYDPPLAQFFFFGSIGLFGLELMQRIMDRNREIAVNDAQIMGGRM